MSPSFTPAQDLTDGEGDGEADSGADVVEGTSSAAVDDSGVGCGETSVKSVEIETGPLVVGTAIDLERTDVEVQGVGCGVAVVNVDSTTDDVTSSVEDVDSVVEGANSGGDVEVNSTGNVDVLAGRLTRKAKSYWSV